MQLSVVVLVTYITDFKQFKLKNEMCDEKCTYYRNMKINKHYQIYFRVKMS